MITPNKIHSILRKSGYRLGQHYRSWQEPEKYTIGGNTLQKFMYIAHNTSPDQCPRMVKVLGEAGVVASCSSGAWVSIDLYQNP